ncbi:triacylglycerol lipase [Trifolium repens]|nr:triacylglycerol lipase [Trifolium repens]
MHTSLSPNEESWDESTSYDLFALVQYVYNHTNKKIYYVGHSQGSLMAFVALSQGKLLNMLRSTALFGSITHMNLIPFVEIRLVADKIYVVYRLCIYEFFSNS